jgi:uncharacterized membrane protein
VERGHVDRIRLVAAGILWLGAGFALQLAVFSHGGVNSLSDLPHLFLGRGVDASHLPYLDRLIEYPVGAGLLLWVATLVHSTALGVLTTTALAAGALALVVGVLLQREVGGRAWRWMVGPPLLLYAFQNWDVFAIAALVAGLVAYRQRRDGAAGLLLGLGTVVKLFPAVVIPVLVAERLAHRDRRGALRLGAAAAAVVAVVNLPFALADPHGWWWPAAFQGRRHATWGSVWLYLDRWLHVPVGTPGAANAVSMLLLAAGLVVLVTLTVRRRIDGLGAAASAVALFVLVNKVYSPTYDLWLVPFFVLIAVPRRWWTAFWLVDLGVYLTVFGYFHGQVARPTLDVVLPVLVWVRVVVVLALVVYSFRRTATPAAVASPAARPSGWRRRAPAVGVS